MRHPRLVLTLVVLAASNALPSAEAAPVVVVARDAEPVVLTGAQIPGWSRLPRVGGLAPWPQGVHDPEFGTQNPFEGVRDAHTAPLVPSVTPPDARAGVEPSEVVAFRWSASGWEEVPVQVDERFPYFLGNPSSEFSFYSGVDEELTYAWDVESWKKTEGECSAAYPDGVGPTADPVRALDDDDEIVFMASDAGGFVEPTAPGPPGTGSTRQQISLVDPLDPSNVRFVYLFLRADGSSFDASNGYVSYQRDPNADQWIDGAMFADDDPEKVGTGGSGYGPNLTGTVCPDGTTPRDSTDRFPRDGVTVTTDAYKWRATGRWMVRDMHVAKPGQPGVYGPDLIDRWKGRAFQQNPDSEISVVGFEEEQTHWEGNSALLGERAGPVRAIREVWGADSGTNTTKTETFYRDAVVYRYHTRVHPVPPDGIYQFFDYNAGVATMYFNTLKPEGVDIDGVNDDVGNIGGVGGTPLFFDAPDPTFNVPLVTGFWDQVSGKDDYGSLVYTYEGKSLTSAENPIAFPYYRDDKCFDDGTGDDPVPRPWPGEPASDARVMAAYGENATCDEKQGAWGAHGVHIFVTNDTDNAFQSKPVTEIDAQQWQFAVPTHEPHSVGEGYANVVRAPLRPVALQLPNTAGDDVGPTTVPITGPLSGQATDPVTLEARLDSEGEPVAGADLRFTFQGASYTDPTDGEGLASVTVDVKGPAGDTPLLVEFDGNASFAESSAQETFEVLHDDSVIEFVATKGRGNAMRVTATLTDEDSGAGLSGKTVRFFVEDVQRATATTDAGGVAHASFSQPVHMLRTFRVAFDGDDTYLGAEAQGVFGPQGASGSSG